MIHFQLIPFPKPVLQLNHPILPHGQYLPRPEDEMLTQRQMATQKGAPVLGTVVDAGNFGVSGAKGWLRSEKT